MVTRCEWAGDEGPMRDYHDCEWGVPVHDDRLLFEFLTLEGAQAGLSWSTILQKRDGYRAAFANFEIDRVAAFDEDRIAALLQDKAIVRNRLKVHSTVANARAILSVADEIGSFDTYIWSFVNATPVRNVFASIGDLPATTPVSDSMSRDLKKRGFRFVGPTICYAFMQATGMVNDHEVGCFRYNAV